jgi:hypothetical protein
VRTLLVEVADVDAEDVLKLAAPEDQEPVEALPAHDADPAFGVGIRVRRLVVESLSEGPLGLVELAEHAQSFGGAAQAALKTRSARS